MDYNQFWNNRTWTQEENQNTESESRNQNDEHVEHVVENDAAEQVNWSQEFDYDDSENVQEPEKYDALISPDAYSYLDNVNESEFNNDSLLDEQDEIEDSDDYDTLQNEEEGVDDSDMYEVGSLFDADENESDEDMSFEDDIEPDTEPEPAQKSESAVETEPVSEVVAETESEQQGESAVATEVEQETENVAQQSDEISSGEKFNLPLFKKIFSFIPDFSTFGVYLKGLSDSDASDLEQFIIGVRDAWFQDNKDKMFTLPDSSITIAVLSETKDPMTEVLRLESVAAQMVASYKEKWNFIELFFEYDGTLRLAVDKEITKDLFADGEWKIIREMGIKLLLSKE